MKDAPSPRVVQTRSATAAAAAASAARPPPPDAVPAKLGPDGKTVFAFGSSGWCVLSEPCATSLGRAKERCLAPPRPSRASARARAARARRACALRASTARCAPSGLAGLLPTRRAPAPHTRPAAQAVRVLSGRGEGAQGGGAAPGRVPDRLLRRRECVSSAPSVLSLNPNPFHLPNATPSPVAGCTLFFDVDLDAMVEYVCGCAVEARSSPAAAFRLRKYVAGALERFADPLTVPAALHGNLEVSVTTLPTLANVRVTDFATWDSVRTHLLATACIVPLAGLPMWVPGLGLVLDGGLSDLQLTRGFRRTGSFCAVHEGWGTGPGVPQVAVAVCPFYFSRAAIKPDAFVPVTWCFYPPPPDKLRWLYAMGQRNAAAWAVGEVARRAGGDAPAACPTTNQPPVAPLWRRAEEAVSAAATRASAAAHSGVAAAEEAATAAAHSASTAAHAVSSAVADAVADAVASVRASRPGGAFSRLRSLSVRNAACAAIYAELLLQACVSGLAAALPGFNRRRLWARARSFAAPLPSLGKLALSPPHSPRAAALLRKQAAALRQLSLVYRIFAFVLDGV